ASSRPSGPAGRGWAAGCPPWLRSAGCSWVSCGTSTDPRGGSPTVPDVRYICLSDLHFGAENSILTSLEADLTVDVDRPSPAMTGLVECLESIVSRNEDRRSRPRLILCGDVLELALADDNVAAMVFGLFARQILGPGSQLIDETIYFVPGNHDHHL